ncbi:MAG: hypothetical protein U0V02_09320 [Anaerolineales bacterium]
MEHALICPQCNAPLKAHRFARSVVCSYCGTTVRLDEESVSAEKFHEAFRVWNSPESYQIPTWISIGNQHWELDKHIAHGDISDVYTGRRARWPTELAIIKLLRDHQNSEAFENEWNIIQTLQKSDSPGADTFTMLIPEPITHGEITIGPYSGRHVSIHRWVSGFHHTFEDVIRVYPQGIPPQASIWVWRRVLETLSFIHASGIVHGAILPPHLLIQDNEHGVRLVGYSSAGKFGQKLHTVTHEYDSFYPQLKRSWSTLTDQLDLVMSAKCVIALLGGNTATALLPTSVPEQLVKILQRVALSKPDETASENAWDIRDELGEIAKEVFGPPQFIPIEMPHSS